MRECVSCGFVSEEDFSECPSCGVTVCDVEEEKIPRVRFIEPVSCSDNKISEYRSGGIPDIVDDNGGAHRGSSDSFRKQSRIAVISVAVLLVSFVTVFAIKIAGNMKIPLLPTSKSSAETSASSVNTAKNTDDKPKKMTDTGYSMTGEFSDYQININGIVYQIHMKLGDIIDCGWSFAEGSEDGLLTAGDKEEILIESVDGAVIQVTVVNFGDGAVPCKECPICEIKVELSRNEKESISIIGGLSLGATSIDEIQKLIGNRGEIVSANRGTVLTCTETETRIAQFTFEKETGKLIGIRFTDMKDPGNFNRTESSSDYDLPESIASDVPLASGIISIHGDIYRLPIDVSLMIERGWDCSFENGSSRISAGARTYATFTRGDAVLSGVDVYNPTISDGYIEECQIISVSSSTGEGWVEFPMGIKVGISEAALKLSVEGMDYEFDDTYFDEYVFVSDQYTFVVNVDAKAGKVIYVSSSYNY